MSVPSRPVTLALFGAAAITSGLIRFLFQPGGHTGLWFGIAVGVASWVSAGLVAIGRSRVGLAIGLVAITMLGGWFFYEALVKKGIAQAEIRQLVMIVVAAVGLLLLARGPAT